MSSLTTHHGIDFIGAAVDHMILHQWYDNLPDSEIKSSIAKIKCREFRTTDRASFRVIVLCEHPFMEQSREIENAKRSDDDARTDRALNALISSFSKWVESHDVSEEVLLGQRHAFIDWWPVEMLHYLTNDPTPQDRAQLEMNHHILDCLDLIRLATVSGPDFLRIWKDSNEPFFAAGRLIYGTFEWVREVPVDLFQDETESAALLERAGEFTREYVGLVRLALAAGAESPLLDRVAFVLRKFKVQYAAEIPVWQAQACELIEDSEAMPIHVAINKPPQYEEIDAICDRLRQNLVEATEGFQHEIPILINALLPTLQVPPSAELFTGDGNP